MSLHPTVHFLEREFRLTMLRSITGLMLLSTAALAQKPAAPAPLVQETFLGSLALMQERGEVQIGTMLNVSGPRSSLAGHMALEIEYGLTDAFELSLESGGMQYERNEGWSAPARNDFAIGLRFGKSGLIPNFHSALSLEVESELEEGPTDARRVTASPGVQLGFDIPRARYMHVFTSASVTRSALKGSEMDATWIAGAVVPVGSLRATLEMPLVLPEDAERRPVAGVIWPFAHGFELGLATTIHIQPKLGARSVLLSVIAEF